MKRYDALAQLMKEIDDELIVCNIGHPSQELFALRDRPENFYMLGSMGLAISIGLGLALSQGRRVVVLDGDAAITMNLGAFATVAHNGPSNLIHVILDNQANGSTGSQPSFTAGGLRLDDVARGAGIRSVHRVAEKEGVRHALRAALGCDGPHVIVVEVSPGVRPSIAPLPYDAETIRRRFVEALGS